MFFFWGGVHVRLHGIEIGIGNFSIGKFTHNVIFTHKRGDLTNAHGKEQDTGTSDIDCDQTPQTMLHFGNIITDSF